MRGNSVLISGPLESRGRRSPSGSTRRFQTHALSNGRAELRTGGYVIDFWGLGYDIAEKMGLGDDARGASATTMRELRVVGDQGEQLAGFGIASP